MKAAKHPVLVRSDDVLFPLTKPADATSIPSVEVRDVSHWFESTSGTANVVLRNIGLNVAPGEFVSLVGPSGCGKTTLLNLIAGVDRPRLGEVRLIGADGTGQVPPQRSLGYMQARDALLPWRTLLDNVILGLQFQRMPRSTWRERAQEALNLVGLGSVGNRYPRQLSHGMRQRGNLARLFATRPDVLLMDEPFGALDAQTKADLQVEFGRIWQRTSTSVVFVTHDLAEAILLGDRVVVMVNGEITSEITVPFERPRDLETIPYDPEFQSMLRSLLPLLKGAH